MALCILSFLHGAMFLLYHSTLFSSLPVPHGSQVTSTHLDLSPSYCFSDLKQVVLEKLEYLALTDPPFYCHFFLVNTFQLCTWMGFTETFPYMHEASVDHVRSPFSHPCCQAFLPSLVPRSHYSTFRSAMFLVSTYDREHAILDFLYLAYLT